jgi:hypothetical protein
MSTQARVGMDREQRRRVRRSALLWGLIALAFYGGFIIHSILRAHA